jgi:hypothetical protein
VKEWFFGWASAAGVLWSSGGTFSAGHECVGGRSGCAVTAEEKRQSIGLQPLGKSGPDCGNTQCPGKPNGGSFGYSPLEQATCGNRFFRFSFLTFHVRVAYL